MGMPTATQMPLRVPASLHQELKGVAAAEGTSLNQYCLYALARHGFDTAVFKQKKGEDLLRFLQEAQLLQAEFDKGKQVRAQEQAPLNPAAESPWPASV